MILAHLPLGRVLGNVLGHVLHRRSNTPWLMPAVMLGAVFPDIDMLWFYLIDDRAFHPHLYWVHIPNFWFALALVALPVIAWAWRAALLPRCGVFDGGAFVPCPRQYRG